MEVNSAQRRIESFSGENYIKLQNIQSVFPETQLHINFLSTKANRENKTKAMCIVLKCEQTLNHLDSWRSPVDFDCFCLRSGSEAKCHKRYPHTSSRTFGAVWGNHSYHNRARPDVHNDDLHVAGGETMISVSKLMVKIPGILSAYVNYCSPNLNLESKHFKVNFGAFSIRPNSREIDPTINQFLFKHLISL